ncbi:MAG: HPP family protein [Acidimicrobiales bacterium]
MERSDPARGDGGADAPAEPAPEEVGDAVTEAVPVPSLEGGLHRLGFALRLGVLGAGALVAVGLVDHFSNWPVLTTALGPTAYVLIAHPRSETARARNAVVGHAVGIGAALASLAVFGLWSAPSTYRIGHASLAQAGAAAMAIGLTLALLHLLRTHHAPAAATTLLVATGLARFGRPLAGLVVGLAIVIALASVLVFVPVPRGARLHGDDA